MLLTGIGMMGYKLVVTQFAQSTHYVNCVTTITVCMCLYMHVVAVRGLIRYNELVTHHPL